MRFFLFSNVVGQLLINMSQVGELIVLSENEHSGSLPVYSGDALTLGRAPECNVRIRLSSVSKISARVVVEAACAFFVNETTVNPAVILRDGSPLDISLGVPVCLKHGDRLSFCSRDFLFFYCAFPLPHGPLLFQLPLPPSFSHAAQFYLFHALLLSPCSARA